VVLQKTTLSYFSICTTNNHQPRLMMRQKSTVIVISLLGLLAVAIYQLNQRGNTIDIDIDGNPLGPIHIEQGNEYNSYGISPERFGQLSEDLGVTKVALRNFFKITEKKQVSLYDLDNTLREIAKHYKELMAKVATLNSDDTQVAELIAQARTALDSVEFDQAEKLFNQATELKISAAHQQLVEAAEYQAANGDLKMAQLAYHEAGKYFERAAKLLPIGNDGTLALYLNNAGYAFNDAALYDKAKLLYERSLAIGEKVFGKEHPSVANILNNLALLYEVQGDYPKAKPLYQQALSILEKVHGKNHPSIATTLNNLAELYRMQGNYDQAKPLYERALAIDEKVYGKEHFVVARDINNLALLYHNQGEYNKAEPLFQRALSIGEKVHGKKHPLVATVLNNLAELHRIKGSYEQAKPLYKRSLAIGEKVFGKEHPDVAQSLNNLALLHQIQGNYSQAKPLYERSLAIVEKILGSEHPDTVNILNNLATMYDIQGDYTRAEPLYQRLMKIIGKTEILVISILPNSQGEKLGIKAGDIFTHYNGEPISIVSRFINRHYTD